MPEQINFSNTINSSLQAGDIAYVSSILTGGITTDPIFVGQVTFKTSRSITVDTTVPGGSTPTVGQFIMFIKNAVAESHGARGYYLEFKLENDSTDPVELFSVGSSVMKSFP